MRITEDIMPWLSNIMPWVASFIKLLVLCITGLIALHMVLHTYNFNHAQDFNEAIKLCKEQTFCQQQVATTYQSMYGKYQQTDLRSMR